MVLNRQSPMSVSIVCTSPDFFLFKNWGFISLRGKMKINILSYLVWNLIVDLQQGHQGHGLMEVTVLEGWGCPRSSLALVTHAVGLEEVDSFKMAENLQARVAVVLRAGSRIWEKEGSRMDCSHFPNPPPPFPTPGSLPSNILFWKTKTSWEDEKINFYLSPSHR